MAFVATISPESALLPDYAGSRRIERWTATALASDSGPATFQARHLKDIDPVSGVQIDAYNGSNPSSWAVVNGNTVLIYLPGSTTATKYNITLSSRY